MRTSKEFIELCTEALKKLDEAEYHTRVGVDCQNLETARSCLIDIVLQGIILTEQDILRLLWNATISEIYIGTYEGFLDESTRY